MNTEQKGYIAYIDSATKESILVKRTGWEEVNLIPHTHNRDQIIYILSGTLHIEIEGCSIFATEHHLAWIPSGSVHRLSSNNRQVSLLIFYGEFQSEQTNKNKLSVYIVDEFILRNLLFIASNGDIHKSSEATKFLFARSFFRLLPTIAQNASLLVQSLIIAHDARLQPILEYITEHLAEELRFEDVAQQFGFSTRNLSRLFHSSGIRFSHYLNYQRITRAIELFTDGGRTLQQIAYTVGFSSPNNFNRVFKQIIGDSPRIYFQYRYLQS